MSGSAATGADRALTRSQLQDWPKAELHVHLDGCLRPQTLLDLGREQGVALPATDVTTLAQAMLVRDAANLEEYLERYYVTVGVMQTPAALERIAYEFVQDIAAENLRYVEVRFGPALHTESMSWAEAFEAPLRGLRRGADETGVRVGLIACALRTMSPDVSLNVAQAAVDYRHDGVVAFDLAGSEAGHPAQDHAAAFRYAARHGLACTCHAGEGDGPASVWQALQECGAQRIGHGTRIVEDSALETYVIDHQIPLEVCLTSNVHTHTVPDAASHPVRRYLDRGAMVTLNTDGRLMDGVSLADEYAVAHTALGFSRDDLRTVVLNACRSAFLPDDARATLTAGMERELAASP